MSAAGASSVVRVVAACAIGLGSVMLGGAPSAFALSLGGRSKAPATSGATAGDQPTHYIPIPFERGRASRYDDPGVLNYGDAVAYGAPTNESVPSPVVGMAATKDGQGYWLVTANGQVYNYGDAANYGGVQGLALDAPIVGMAATPDGGGYWLVGLDGGVFSFGDAAFYGSAAQLHLVQPIVGIAADPAGGGYWLAAGDGGVFAFGAAPFLGSMGATRLDAPVVGISATSSGDGYILAGGDGGIFNFGDASFFGSLGDTDIPGWITSVAEDATDGGYWLADAAGEVYQFGNAANEGSDSAAPHSPPIAQIVPTPDSGGYWLLEPDAFPTVFSAPASDAIVSLASTQIQGDPDSGYFCNPYGPCEAWCALFATWVWANSGIDIPSYAFVGDIYDWAERNTEVLSPTQTPRPGDIVLYGTGPANVDTAVHTGIVAQVWPDGAIDTIEGDAGPAPTGDLSVVINGPFLPSDSANYNGFPIFGFAVP